METGEVRIVFDAAAKAGRVSLNNNLLTEPDWLVSLFGVILKFLQHKVAFTADIREMCNRFQITEEDTYSLHASFGET